MLKIRTLSLLLSLLMLLTFMPAMAFAEDAADDTPDQPAAAVAEETAEEANAVEATVEEQAAEETAEPQETLDAKNAEAAEGGVKSLSYKGGTLYYEPGDTAQDVDLYADGVVFEIVYSDGAKKVVPKEFNDGWFDYFFEDEAPVFDEDSDYPINTVEMDFNYDKAATEKVIYVTYGGASTKIPVAEKVYPKPKEVEFVPSNGFIAESRIGADCIHNYELFGEGNKFVITWDDGNVHTYQYKETKDETAFFLVNSDGEDRVFYEDIMLDGRVAAGESTVTGKIAVRTDYGEEMMPVSVKVSANLYNAYVEDKTYSYTGKNIKPKVVVRYFDDKTKKMKKMPAKWYTCKPKKHKAIGGYPFEVKIKKKYQAKYGMSLWGMYEIIPKTPAIKKATGGTGNLTVTWGKFSKAVRKATDGFFIQVCADKKCEDVIEMIEAKPGDTKATVKDLEKGTYYVCIVSYKKLAEDDERWSKPSKIKTVTVN